MQNNVNRWYSDEKKTSNENIQRFDIEDTFNRIGRVRDVWVARKPPGFAFVEMEDRRDAQVKQAESGLPAFAQDAVRELDGTRMCGNRVKVGPFGNSIVAPNIGFLLPGGNEQWR